MSKKSFIEDVKKIVAETIYKSSINNKLDETYLKETKQLVKKFKHQSFANFWKTYISGANAPHYHIPYNGHVLTKLPCDMFIYKDIISKAKPEVIIEIGTGKGGSTIFFSECSNGDVVTIDIHKPVNETLNDFKDRNIRFIHGGASSDSLLRDIVINYGDKKCMVIDDGSHMMDHVYKAFKYLNVLIPNGGFYIVEDGVSSFIYGRGYRGNPCFAISRILYDYPSFGLFRDYDRFAFSTILRGVLQRN